ncbi:hypothetical protein IFT95_24260, partial [Pantoea agglomerans]|nr:hypothetical protein [Pantoea agglomerans]MBD8243797.1 hypothetical protein [Pantoea agglomerans]MBD8245171.1 hypothetical protein [Pantoea agglomerans]MBD8245274.1 hypothetical protein [Pantoea agglomerans]
MASVNVHCPRCQ